MKIICVVMLLVGICCSSVFADEATEQLYLTEILNSLSALQPLILKAEQSQPKDLRETFHYEKFKDSQGKVHNGLLNDVQEIKQGIEKKLNSKTIEPRTIAPLQGDYLNTARK